MCPLLENAALSLSLQHPTVVAEGRGDGFRMRREAWDDFVHGSHTLLLADGGDGSLQHRGCNRRYPDGLKALSTVVCNVGNSSVTER